MECGPEQVCGFKNARDAARAYDRSKVFQYGLIEAFPYLNLPDKWQDHRKRLLKQLWLAASTVLSAAWAPPAYPERETEPTTATEYDSPATQDLSGASTVRAPP
jgi:hypothetical protein